MEAIRNVVIRVHLERVADSFNTAVDSGQSSQLTTIQQALDSLNQKWDESRQKPVDWAATVDAAMSQAGSLVQSTTQTIADSFRNTDQSTATLAEKFTSLTTAMIEQAAANGESEASWNALADALQVLGEEMEAEEKAAEQLAKKLGSELAASQRQLVSEAGNVRTALATAGDGVIQLYRGFVLLNTSKDDMRATIQELKRFQIVVDVFRGTGAVINSAVEGFKSLQTISSTLSKQQAILAQQEALVNAATELGATTSTNAAVAGQGLVTTNVAIGTSARAAGAGLTSMQAAFPPLLLVSLAVQSALAAVAFVMATVNSEAEEGKTALEEYAERLELLKQVGFASGLTAQNAGQAIIDRVDSGNRLAGLLPLAEQLQAIERENFVLGLRQAEAAQAYRFHRSALVQEGQKDVQAWQELKPLAETQVTLTEKGIDQQRQRLGLVRQLADQERDILDQHLKQLETAEKLVEKENARAAAARGSLGALSQVDAALVDRLANTFAANGQLTKGQLKELASLNIQALAPFLEGQFARQPGVDRLVEALKKFGVDIDAAANVANEQLEQLKQRNGTAEEIRAAIEVSHREQIQTEREIVDLITKQTEEYIRLRNAVRERDRQFEQYKANNS